MKITQRSLSNISWVVLHIFCLRAVQTYFRKVVISFTDMIDRRAVLRNRMFIIWRSCLLDLITDTVIFYCLRGASPSDIFHDFLFKLNLLLQFLYIAFDVLFMFFDFGFEQKLKHFLQLLNLISRLFLIEFDVIGLFYIDVKYFLVNIFMLDILDVFFLNFFFKHSLDDFDQILSDVIYYSFCGLAKFF